MRKALALAVLFGCAWAATAQQPAGDKEEVPVPDRFGVPHKGPMFSQATPKETLASVIAAVERGRIEYVVAHLLDPGFVEARILQHARTFEAAMEADLTRLRETQRLTPLTVSDAERIPDDPRALQQVIVRASTAKAVQQMIADVQVRLAEDPETLKELRRFLRDGTFADADPTSKVTLPDVKERAVFFKKIGDRWFIENRQVEEKAPPAPAAPAMP